MTSPTSLLAEHRLETPRTARYYLIGAPGPAVRDVWACCHGYGQLARDFAAYLRPIAEDANRLGVVPEALSRFYLERGDRQPHAERPVGASWMTREDRDAEIHDHVRWLDAAVGDALGASGEAAVRFSALGFSQGAATAFRWAQRTTRAVEHLVIWGGLVAPDVMADLEADPGALRARRLTLVVGRYDRLVNRDTMAAQHAVLQTLGDRYQLLEFEGGHRMDLETLRRVCSG